MTDSKSPSSPTKKPLLQLLGPGLLYAGAAVGVSHLVQSTRAGAEFGFILIWAVILANVIKYPFFEFGPRYAAATGKSLLDGYKKLGTWALALFIIMTICTMFIVQSAITVVTAGLAQQLTGIVLAPWQWSGILLLICSVILGFGRYSVLDKLMKVIILVLTTTTVLALIAAFFADVPQSEDFMTTFSWDNKLHIFFLVALVGWMPAPIDISVWHSVWAVAKEEETGNLPVLKEVLLDFKIGYWGTTLLAICFVALGALVMYGTGEELSASGGVFARQVITLYTSGLGGWSYFIIAVAAFTTMFSTTLTCLDAYSRVVGQATTQLIPKSSDGSGKNRYLQWIFILVAGTMVLLIYFLDNMRTLVDLATTISFLTAPILALLNHFAVHSKSFPPEARPGPLLKIMSWVGILILTGFSVYYLFLQFNAS